MAQPLMVEVVTVMEETIYIFCASGSRDTR
nr:MAG TPA: hypothetical protein [Caudoviricetes sp.]